MTLGGSRSITDQRVYAQNTQPADERDGVLWVDTSQSARPMFTYSADTAAWEPVAPDAIHRQGTEPAAPSDGDVWVETDVSPQVVRTYDSGANAWDRAGKTDAEVAVIANEEGMKHSGGYAPGFGG